MNIIYVILLSLTICIDSFILCLLTKCSKKLNIFLIPFIFTIFQISFIYIGYNLGNILEKNLENYINHFMFLVFSFMGLKTIINIFISENKKEPFNSLKAVIIQATLTSFDSLFLGIPFAFSNDKYLLFISIVAICTFSSCFIALIAQKKANSKLEEKINLIGAIILFFFAFKSLI